LRFLLFVEGHTEDKALPGFLKRWLDPRLSQPVGIRVVRFQGWRDYAKEIPKKVALNLSGRTGEEVIAAIGIIDLYGPTIYPSHLSTTRERYEWGRQHFEAAVRNGRFHQHFAVHETEAWLLSEPAIFPEAVRQRFPGRIQHPETVNFDEPPAALLDRLYRQHMGRGYRKVIDGSTLFQALPPETAHARCPNLQRLLDEMLQLAQQVLQ
jgi:uncharacterized protein DUF4276